MNLTDFFQYEFLQWSLAATLLLALAMGILSPAVVAKKLSFSGAAIAHSTLLAVSLALFFASPEDETAFFCACFFFTLILVVFLAHTTYQRQKNVDAQLGVFFSVTMAMGVLVYQYFHASTGNLLGILFGNLFLTSKVDLYILSTLSAVLLFLAIRTPWSWANYLNDEQHAKFSGPPLWYFHWGLYLLMGAIIVAAIKIAGSVLVATLLVLPGMFALNFAPNLRKILPYSILFSLLSSLLGLLLANYLNTSPGASIAVTQFFLHQILLAIRSSQNLARRK